MSEPETQYSVTKGQVKGLSSASSIFGVTFFSGWLAQLVLPVVETNQQFVPQEIATQAGLTAFFVYIMAVVKDWLVLRGRWPSILT